ncbi:hypothetical protein B7R78_0021280 [Ralstonia solanacearum]|uniref:hypothetical protein n=1 Tax=Ralstonia solanacearum TaxID=305 RepID=UPI0015E8C662|nr:hypothetical protein [Ralstonia solanacearum]MBT1539522.1 hypothetical protein [Ralstonia solanacearum]
MRTYDVHQLPAIGPELFDQVRAVHLRNHTHYTRSVYKIWRQAGNTANGLMPGIVNDAGRSGRL